VRYKLKQEGDITIAELSGNIMGGPDFDKFHGDIKAALEAGARRFLFDFSKATWINSTGLGIIVACHLSISGAAGRMVICGSNKRIEGVYYVSRLEKIFETHPSVEAGLAALA